MTGIDNSPAMLEVAATHGRVRNMLEQAGFTYIRSKGKNHSVMRKTVRAKWTRAKR